MMKGELSVVVPAYNAATTIGDCVAALCGQDFDQPFEVIVVDDGSDDETAAIAARAGARVITTPRGRPAAARNVGLRAARGDIVCFTDADCAPHRDWLRHIVAPLAAADVVGSKGIYATRQRALVARFVQLEYEDKYDYLRREPVIDFIDTYSCAYRRDVVLAHGGFDERFHYAEDQELSFRLAARGCRMVFCESAVVDHRHSATLRAYLRKKLTIGYWKAQVMRRFSGRPVRDSHTPPVMKVQLLLAAWLMANVAAGLAVLVLGVGRWGGVAWWALAPAALAALLFLLTTLRFVRKAWHRDRAVALAAPGLLFGRAVALGVGYARGRLRPRPDIGRGEL